NPIVSKWMGQFGDTVSRFFRNFSEYVSFGRVALWLGVGFAVWTFLRGRSRLNGARLDARIFSSARISDHFPPTGLIVRCLILFNLIFAVELALDLTTVVSNGANLPEAMTYSEYARRGAYPLVATALLAAAFVLSTFPTGLSTAAKERLRWARRLVCAWIA